MRALLVLVLVLSSCGAARATEPPVLDLPEPETEPGTGLPGFEPPPVGESAGRWTRLFPPIRAGLTTFDPVSQRIVAFTGVRGSEHGEIWFLDPTRESAPRRVVPAGELPPGSVQAAHIDPVRRQLIVLATDYYSRTRPIIGAWALDVDRPDRWVRIARDGPAPSPRNYFSSVIDDAHSHLYLYGGHETPGSDLWRLDFSVSPAVWTKLETDNPPPHVRFYGQLIIDAARNRMLLLGGFELQRFPDGGSQERHVTDMWSLRLTRRMVWERIEPSGEGPAALGMSSPGVLDAENDQLLVPERAWSGSGALLRMSLRGEPAWTRSVTMGLVPREASIVALLPGGTEMLVVQSYFANWRLRLANPPVWSFDGLPIPSHLSTRSSALDPVDGSLVVLTGGLGAWQRPGSMDLWKLSVDGTAAWRLVTTPGTEISRRERTTLRYDPRRDRFIVVGGYVEEPEGTRILDDVWELRLRPLPRWTRLEPENDIPVRGVGFSMVYDAIGDRMILQGGDRRDAVDGEWRETNEAWALELSPALRWRRIEASGRAPAPRTSHALAVDLVGEKLLLFGGLGVRTYAGYGSPRRDLWSLPLTPGAVWDSIPAIAVPRLRSPAELLLCDHTRDRLWLMGSGQQGTELHELEAASGAPSWSSLRVDGNIPAVSSNYHSIAEYDARRDRILYVPYRIEDVWMFEGGAPEHQPEIRLKSSGHPGTATTRLELVVLASHEFDPRSGDLSTVRICGVPISELSSVRERWRDVNHDRLPDLELDLEGAPGWWSHGRRAVTITGGTRNGERFLGWRLIEDEGGPWDDSGRTAELASNEGDPDRPFEREWESPVAGLDRSRFRYRLSGATSESVEMFTATGRRVSRTVLTPTGGQWREAKLEQADGLPSGIYFLRWPEGALNRTERIVRLR
ncbi:MAG: Kelch repeat-containing protein [Candidatus Eiseniibacteriota bacterium]